MNTRETRPSDLHKHRLTIAEYYRVAESGALAEDARTELINGEIYDMAPAGSPHSGIVNRLTRLLVDTVGDRAIVTVQNPIQLPLYSEPQPDLALLRPREDYYTRSHPQPEDILLVIEVADSSLYKDRNIKVPLYASYNIPDVWLINVTSLQLSVYREPQVEQYGSITEAADLEAVTIAALPTLTLDLTDLFVGLQRTD